MNQPVEFLRYWRGRQPGTVTDSLDYGVAQQLVQRGFAQWVKDDPPQPQSEEALPRRARKR